VANVEARWRLTARQSNQLQGVVGFHGGRPIRAPRFFPPESGGLFFNSDLPSGVFRIDHDQNLEQTTQVQYQFQHWKKLLPYVNFTWRYDSGLVAGSVPDFATALGFTADQQARSDFSAAPLSPRQRSQSLPALRRIAVPCAW